MLKEEALDSQAVSYERDIARLEKEKNGAYKERDMLLTLLTKLIPRSQVWLERHPETDTVWEDDWRWIVFVQLPTGQASWHIHDSELPWFEHVRRVVFDDQSIQKNSWDGHTTPQKYERVMSVPTPDVCAGWFKTNT